MKVGLQIRSFTWPGGDAAIGPTLARIARDADTAGFDSIWVMDHFFQIRGVGRVEEPMLEGMTALGFLAAHTERARLGLMVGGVPYRTPALWIKATTTLDVLSGGRAWLGIGAAWNEQEAAALGIPFPPLGERFDRYEEQLAILTGLWATPVGESFDFEGAHYRLAGSPALPKPVQDGGVPILVGGRGRTRTPRLAARYAAEFNVPFSSAEDNARLFARVRGACEEAGRDPSSLVYSSALVLCVGRDETEIARRAAAIGGEVDELREHGVAGTPAEAVDTLGRYAEAGAERVYLQVLDLADLDHLDLVAAEVAPQLH
jgi:F420-dependent oxidoreductase-like protein